MREGDKLKLPVGLITADEYALAGGGVPNNGSSYYNTTFWLHTGKNYLTMTPSSFVNGIPADADSLALEVGVSVFYASSSGFFKLIGHLLMNDDGVRPVINLKASTLFSSGNGTAEKPYVVKV